MMINATGETTNTLLMDWSFYEFYHKVSYLSHVNAYQRRYSEALRRKK